MVLGAGRSFFLLVTTTLARGWRSCSLKTRFKNVFCITPKLTVSGNKKIFKQI